jgi:hypothetical protein
MVNFFGCGKEKKPPSEWNVLWDQTVWTAHDSADDGVILSKLFFTLELLIMQIYVKIDNLCQ